jgi:hypothetical protein
MTYESQSKFTNAVLAHVVGHAPLILLPFRGFGEEAKEVTVDAPEVFAVDLRILESLS